MAKSINEDGCGYNDYNDADDDEEHHGPGADVWVR